MLKLKQITKVYKVADEEVAALKGITLRFRKNEFVSILGPSGCGKTTLLNIIGGLDKYTSGDLIIEGRSTKTFKDKDWDTYRNHSIGFIFQSYHLIPHQTILQNVELALMMSGVSKSERRRRAISALEKVGLSDKIHNKPNQLSGGQAQRVAIARALINDPEILLADEPTGALDSKTSVQIMDLLKDIAKDRLVIMVTHNPELAEKYSTRIIRLLDGQVVGDSRPYKKLRPVGEQAVKKQKVKKEKGKKKNSSMPRRMAMGLSLKNLLSKGKRTAMVSVAGSIGIVGVSLVLAISSGVQGYITDMQNDMLSGYPISITKTALNYDSIMDMTSDLEDKINITKLDDRVYVNSLLETMTSLTNISYTNTITREYIDYVDNMPKEYYNALQYAYEYNISNNIYTDFKVATGRNDPSDGNMSISALRAMYTAVLYMAEDYRSAATLISTISSFAELPNNYEYILSQYDILATNVRGETQELDAGDLTTAELESIFNSKDSVVMVVSGNEITDITLGQYGYFTEEEFLNYAFNATEDELYEESVGLVGELKEGEDGGLTYDYFLGKNAKHFTWYPNSQTYKLVDPYTHLNTAATSQVKYNAYSDGFDEDSGVDLKVKVILQKKSNISYGCLSSGFYYTNQLTKHALNTNMAKDAQGKFLDPVAQHILDNGGKVDVIQYRIRFTTIGNDGTDGKFTPYSETTIPTDANSMMAIALTYGTIVGNNSDMMSQMMGMMGGGGTYAADNSVTLNAYGGDDMPSSIFIYPVDFDTKDEVTGYLDGWNKLCKENGSYTYNGSIITLAEENEIKYTDQVGLIISMVNTMIDMITIALVCFTGLSLIVSTVMIGIITYVSVVERVKEIGILRAVGARKKDIKRLFNSETFIIGLTSGVFGIGVTYLASAVINLIVGSLAGIYTIAALPISQAIIMIIISVALTLVSGLIPASAAAKKDPVVALRTE